MDETTSSQFVMWMEYLEQESNSFHREDFYLAQIAAEIRRWMAKNPESIKLENFLLKFAAKGKVQTPPDPELKLKNSKGFWTAVLGLKKSRKRR